MASSFWKCYVTNTTLIPLVMQNRQHQVVTNERTFSFVRFAFIFVNGFFQPCNYFIDYSQDDSGRFVPRSILIDTEPRVYFSNDLLSTIIQKCLNFLFRSWIVSPKDKYKDFLIQRIWWCLRKKEVDQAITGWKDMNLGRCMMNRL